jgi:hypothetical protein
MMLAEYSPTVFMLSFHGNRGKWPAICALNCMRLLRVYLMIRPNVDEFFNEKVYNVPVYSYGGYTPGIEVAHETVDNSSLMKQKVEWNRMIIVRRNRCLTVCNSASGPNSSIILTGS